MGNKKTKFFKAIDWINEGNRIVKVEKDFVEKIQKVLGIKLKLLSRNKYLVISK